MDPLAPVPTGSTSVAIRPGTLIGDYQVIQRLDEGGMGTVYSAVHPVIEKKVAIKVLHPHVARQEETVARFIQEARAVNAIGHPGIIDIFGFGRFVDGRHYIIMEYLEGQQLLAYLNEHGPMTGVETLRLVRLLAESLAAAHDKGVVHRDMKPENVFLLPLPDGTWPPRTKILDFGLAKLIEAEYEKTPQTRAGVTVGTPYYMSPEQCRGKVVDARTDVYALGVMTYEMLTGRVPFYAPESVDVLYMHLTQTPEPPSKYRFVAPEIEKLILRCMAKTAVERPASMNALLDEIDEILKVLDPTDPAAAERSPHELIAEAQAFFGTLEEAPSRTPPSPSRAAIAAPGSGDPNRVTTPVRATEPPEESAPADARVPALPSSPTAATATATATDRERPTLPTPAPREPSSEPAAERPVAVLPQIPASVSRPAAPAGAPPRDSGAVTQAVARPEELLPARAARSRTPWILLAVETVVLVAVLIWALAGRGTGPGSTPSAAPRSGQIEVRSQTPVDISIAGEVMGKGVTHLVIAHLPGGKNCTLEYTKAGAEPGRLTVPVAEGTVTRVNLP
jgi:serine/threonine-protein kinase